MNLIEFIRTISYLFEFHIFLCLIYCIDVQRSQITFYFRVQHYFTFVRLKILNIHYRSLISDSNGRSIETVSSYVKEIIIKLSIFSNKLLC